MAVDLESLLDPVASGDPVGPDLSYDDERIAIEAAFESGFSDDGARRDEVNWSDVIRRIESQFARTKDLWLAAYLARAGARAGRLDVAGKGAAAMAGLLEAYWQSVHPQLDEFGLQGRVAPCSSLASIREFLAPLRRAILVTHPRLGQYSAADFERFSSEGDAAEGHGQFRAALADLPDEALSSALEQIEGIAAALKRADAAFAANAEGEGPQMQPAFDVLAQMRAAVERFARRDAVSPGFPGEGANDGAGASNPAAMRPAFLGGRIESRDAVLEALDAVADYYRRREPASPVAPLIERARSWVTLDFLTVLEDIAPGSLDEVRRVLVSQRVEREL